MTDMNTEGDRKEKNTPKCLMMKFCCGVIEMRRTCRLLNVFYLIFSHFKDFYFILYLYIIRLVLYGLCCILY